MIEVFTEDDSWISFLIMINNRSIKNVQMNFTEKVICSELWILVLNDME